MVTGPFFYYEFSTPFKVRMNGRRMRDLMSHDRGPQLRKTSKKSDHSVTTTTTATTADPSLVRDQSIRYHTKKREKDLTRTLLIICFSYVVCVLPASLLAIFNPMPPCWNMPELHVAFYVIFWSETLKFLDYFRKVKGQRFSELPMHYNCKRYVSACKASLLTGSR